LAETIGDPHWLWCFAIEKLSIIKATSIWVTNCPWSDLFLQYPSLKGIQFA
jgi:hypothetical protein